MQVMQQYIPSKRRFACHRSLGKRIRKKKKEVLTTTHIRLTIYKPKCRLLNVEYVQMQGSDVRPVGDKWLGRSCRRSVVWSKVRVQVLRQKRICVPESLKGLNVRVLE